MSKRSMDDVANAEMRLRRMSTSDVRWQQVQWWKHEFWVEEGSAVWSWWGETWWEWFNHRWINRGYHGDRGRPAEIEERWVAWTGQCAQPETKDEKEGGASGGADAQPAASAVQAAPSWPWSNTAFGVPADDARAEPPVVQAASADAASADAASSDTLPMVDWQEMRLYDSTPGPTESGEAVMMKNEDGVENVEDDANRASAKRLEAEAMPAEGAHEPSSGSDSADPGTRHRKRKLRPCRLIGNWHELG